MKIKAKKIDKILKSPTLEFFTNKYGFKDYDIYKPFE